MYVFKNKKGFTLVELVIVIAVIAILAAVLIPTFTSLIKKANMSSDEVAVRNMNEILSLEEIDREFSSIADVCTVLSSSGIDAKNYKPLSEGYAFYWVKEINRIVLVDENKNVLYPVNVMDNLSYDEDTWFPLYSENRLFPNDAPVANLVDLQEGVDYNFSNYSISQTNNQLTSIEQCQVVKQFTPIDKDGDDFYKQLDQYGDWVADFAIILNDDFKNGSGGICGYYKLVDQWVFMVIDEFKGYPGYDENGEYFKAGTEFSLMDLLGGNFYGCGIPYSMIIGEFQNGDAFTCGAFNFKEENISSSITVQLRLYEPTENGWKRGENYIVCNELICEFDSVKNNK